MAKSVNMMRSAWRATFRAAMPLPDEDFYLWITRSYGRLHRVRGLRQMARRYLTRYGSRR